MSGRSVAWRFPAEAIVAGIGMVHQHFALVPGMTVAENVELGARASGGWLFDIRTAQERTRALRRVSGLEVDPTARIAELSVAAQQRVEILKALSHDATILILDEPTAVLAPQEVDDLLHWLRKYTNTGGSAVLITHKLREALAVADDVTVLRRGRMVLAAHRPETDEETLSRAMIGEDLRRVTTPHTTPALSAAPLALSAAPPAIPPVAVLDEVLAVCPQRREKIRATLVAHVGEILGIAGVEGAGHHTLLRLLAGRIRPISGRLPLPQSIGYIPEDRPREGLVLHFSVAENVALRGAGDRRGWMPWPVIHRRTATLIRDYDIRVTDVHALAGTLSGGNQQRLVLARELDGQPTLIVAENPTRGLDMRATADVHTQLCRARDAGAAVVFYSSDLDEVLALATRVIAVHAGIVHEVVPEKESVGRAILGLL
jgi:general nucleoside transport system ATP-binding protein